MEFKPKKLQADLKKAMLKLLEFSQDDYLFQDTFEIYKEDFEFDEYDEIISKKTLIEFYLTDYDGEIQITCEELIKLANKIAEAKLVDNLECESPNSYLIRVEAEDYQSHINMDYGLSENYTGSIKSGFENQTTCDSKNYIIRILNGNALFRLLYAKETREHEDSPPTDFDYFIEIYSEDQIISSDISKILNAYKFELATTSNIKVKYVPLPTFDYNYEEDEEDDNSTIKLRPLMFGEGIDELISLFNNANESLDSEIKILSFTKIFEYVSQTILREQLNVIISNKLNSPRALIPDANYIRELKGLFEEQKWYKKDKQAITLTILKCCDAIELKRYAPKFLFKINCLTVESKEIERRQALEEFATVLVDTRNSVAHAKSNYTPTGDECPEEELYEFANCVKFASEQAIRTFNNIDLSKRIC